MASPKTIVANPTLSVPLLGFLSISKFIEQRVPAVEPFRSIPSTTRYPGTLPAFLVSHRSLFRDSVLEEKRANLAKCGNYGNYAEQNPHFRCSEKHSHAMDFCYHAPLQICRCRCEEHFYFLVAVVNRSRAFLIYS